MRYLSCAAFLLLSFVLVRPALAEELCEIESPDGTISYVSCCQLGGEAEPSPECKDLDAALETADIIALKRAITRNNLNSAAAFLRSNPDVSIGAFTIESPVQEFRLWCCSCVPGKNCNANVFTVCDPPSDGQCPSGDLRVVCSGYRAEHAECTSID